MSKKSNLQSTESTRVVIVGAGLVGSTSAFAIMSQGIASEIVLIDVNRDKCAGEALDLQHGLCFAPCSKVWAGDYSDCKDADVIVITAGVGRIKPDQTRLDLANINFKIVSDIVKNVRRHTSKAIILMVTNPLDVMTYTALKTSGFPPNQVLGTGTCLDTSRFRFLLAQRFGVAPKSIDGFILGEHGDSEVPIFSHANLAGEPLSKLPQWDSKIMEKICEKTRNAAYEVIAKKGATYYSIALTVARIVRAVLYDEDHIFPVSTLLTGQYGIKNVCLSAPCIVGRTGIKRVLELNLDKDELKKLRASAAIIKKTIDPLFPSSVRRG